MSRGPFWQLCASAACHQDRPSTSASNTIKIHPSQHTSTSAESLQSVLLPAVTTRSMPPLLQRTQVTYSLEHRQCDTPISRRRSTTRHQQAPPREVSLQSHLHPSSTSQTLLSAGHETRKNISEAPFRRHRSEISHLEVHAKGHRPENCIWQSPPTPSAHEAKVAKPSTSNFCEHQRQQSLLFFNTRLSTTSASLALRRASREDLHSDATYQLILSPSPPVN